MKLNLGCSDSHMPHPEWINVDRVPPADQIVDLDARMEQATQDMFVDIQWPWIDSSISRIRAWDIIEHLHDKIHTMNECWRVLEPDGLLDIAVPTTDGRGAWQDPTHVSYWNRNSFFYFTHGDPHRERFGKAYGVTARFEVVSEATLSLIDQVVKLNILLRAVKP